MLSYDALAFRCAPDCLSEVAFTLHLLHKHYWTVDVFFLLTECSASRMIIDQAIRYLS